MHEGCIVVEMKSALESLGGLQYHGCHEQNGKVGAWGKLGLFFGAMSDLESTTSEISSIHPAGVHNVIRLDNTIKYQTVLLANISVSGLRRSTFDSIPFAWNSTSRI